MGDNCGGDSAGKDGSKSDNMALRRFGVALFGTGRIGTVHFNNLVRNERIALKWLVEEDLPKAQNLISKHQLNTTQVARTSEVARVLQDKSVDAVLVCSPSFTHEKIVKDSLSAGKAVFCEKPLAPSIEATKSCYDDASSNSLPLFCAFNRRYDPQLRKLFNIVKSGELGKVRVVKSCSRDPPAMMTKEYLQTSGGIFIDSAVHDIDIVCWLVGEQPMSVYATGSATDPMFAECDDVDTCAITLRFPGGAIGVIEVSRNAPVGYDQRVEVLGVTGMLQSNNKNQLEVQRWGMESVVNSPIIDDCCARYTDAYRFELEHFLNVLEGKEKLEVTEISTVAVNKIAVACKESLDTGKVIDLTFDN